MQKKKTPCVIFFLSFTSLAIFLEIVFGLSGLGVWSIFFVAFPSAVLCFLFCIFMCLIKKARSFILILASLMLAISFGITAWGMFFLAFLQSSYPVAREIRYVFPGALHVYANFDPLSPSSTFKNVGLQFFSPDFIVWFIVTAFILLDHFKKKEKRKNPEKNNPPDQTSLPE